MARLAVIAVLAMLVNATSAQQMPQTGDSEAMVPRVSRAFYAPPSACSGIDALGRCLPLTLPGIASSETPARKVGMFYFLWHGAHGPTGHVYDITKICAQTPDAGHHPELFGGYGVYHWWGEPLFGYYTNQDEWVMRRHIVLLAHAGVDFVVFDTTNAETYTAAAIRFLNLLLHYRRLGLAVPQAAFYTHTQSGLTINRLYTGIYAAHPEFAPLWFQIDGRPMVIGIDDGKIAPEAKAFFRIKRSQWPNELDKKGHHIHHRDGFPWMSFETKQHHFNAVRPSVMSVSVAQHCGTCAFSSSTFYGDKTNHPRSWHDGALDTSPLALLGGANFEQQFNRALECAPDIVFVTGWNEWVAGNWSKDPKKLLFVDCCDINGSRDIEMMRGGYGDNYYMQLIAKIRQYKGMGAQQRDALFRRFDMARPEAWEAMTARFRNYPDTTLPRQSRGFDGREYRVESGRNDIVEARMAHDKDYLYVAVQTAAPLTPSTDPRWMMCFIATELEGTPRYLGYDFLLNRLPAGDKATLEKRTPTGWTAVASCRLVRRDNELKIAIPFDALGLAADIPGRIHFKWSDNQTDALMMPAQTADAFYIEGCCAPAGRLNYVYQW